MDSTDEKAWILWLRRTLALLTFVAALVLLAGLVSDARRIQSMEMDLAEMNHVRYGLLDADQWVERLSAIVAKRIDTFELTEANRPQVVAAVAQVLNSMLDEIEHYLRRRNLRSGGSWMDQLQGALQQGLQDLLVDFDKLRRKIPEYSEAVVDQLSKPETKEEIRRQLIELIQQTSSSTFAETDRIQLERLLARYGCNQVERCSRDLETEIRSARRPLRQRLWILIGLLFALFPLCLLGGPARSEGMALDAQRRSSWVSIGRLDPFALMLLTGATLALLAGGILTPMIEIEARIAELRLEFWGEPVVFTDQVLYFQTKSIFEVVRILTATGKPDMALVAVLITLFSIVFPTLKLISTYLYYYDVGSRRGRGARANPVIAFFALRSGKWSMADVMVVALFMAYIGFDGLVASQLGSLARTGTEPGSASASLAAQVLTTNGTMLDMGFYLFLSFVLASLLLSVVLERSGLDRQRRRDDGL
ncbi:hypothetical protein D779_4114 [Imhoffiella purpurea]|uniref:Paraquat-inducible protein A n=2 Tax=Imhoffiella purpurea TaxID=1249627 RepID=W9VHS9_9GAMM|nr:hypothetical protein D779_4114 [Imhoffiella purpurea]